MAARRTTVLLQPIFRRYLIYVTFTRSVYNISAAKN